MSFGKFKQKDSEVFPLFDGGLNTKAYQNDVKFNQTPDAQNVVLDDYGAFGTITGYTVLNTFPIGSAPINGSISYKNDSATSSQLLAVCNQTAWRLSGTTFQTIASSQDVFTSSVDCEIHQFQNLAFFSNGIDNPYKYNGTEFTRMGVPVPTQTMSVATNGAGTLTGSYEYVYAGVNSYGIEGDYGVMTASFTAASEAIAVGNIPTAPVSHGIASWNIYRNTAGASGTFYRVTNVTNGTTSFVDNNSDSTLLTAAPLDNAGPYKFKYFANFQGYLFGAGVSDNPSYLFWSAIDAPETWPADNYIKVGEGDGLKITGINIINSSLMICKSNSQGVTSTYTLFNDDPNPANWYLLKTDAEKGSESHKAITKWENQSTMLNGNGIYGFNGTQTLTGAGNSEIGSILVDSLSDDIEPNIKAINKTLIGGSAAINYNNKIYFSIPSTSSSTENDQILIYDYVRISSSNRKLGAWIPQTDTNVNNFVIHQNELYGGSSLSDGYVYKLDTGTNFNGTAINSYFTTAPFKGKKGHENLRKIFRHAYIYLEFSGAWNLTVYSIGDYNTEDQTTHTIYLESPGEQWDVALFDISRFSVVSIRGRVKIDLGEEAYSMQLKFTNSTLNQYYKISRIEVSYNVKGVQ